MGSLPSTNMGFSPTSPSTSMESSLSTNLGYSLPEELVEEILVRLPLDEPVHLARASLVCKAWRGVLSDLNCFLRRCREFHRAPPPPPPLLGYIQNGYNNSSPIQFVTFFPAASIIVSPVIINTCTPAIDCSGWCALDCRHGRVLILDSKGKQLIVWDPITGSQQLVNVPSARYWSYPSYCYAGAVLCAKDGCDHLDCHGGPFHVVLVEAKRTGPQFVVATKNSSITSVWGAPTCNDISHHSDYRVFPANGKHSLLIGEALYFPYGYGNSIIIKYDLCAHWLSEVNLPRHLYGAILMEAEDGGLGLATLKDNCIYLWSQDVHNVIVPWAKHRVINLRTLVPRQVPFESYKVIGFAEGANTIFINISTEIFMLNLESEKVRKVGEREPDRVDPILPYMSF